jgi:ribonuclease HI
MSQEVHIYTDGAAKGNPRQGGYGVVMDVSEGKTYRKVLKDLFDH